MAKAEIKETTKENAAGTPATIQRRRRPKRRSTGVVQIDMEVLLQKSINIINVFFFFSISTIYYYYYHYYHPLVMVNGHSHWLLRTSFLRQSLPTELTINRPTNCSSFFLSIFIFISSLFSYSIPSFCFCFIVLEILGGSFSFKALDSTPPVD